MSTQNSRRTAATALALAKEIHCNWVQSLLVLIIARQHAHCASMHSAILL